MTSAPAENSSASYISPWLSTSPLFSRDDSHTSLPRRLPLFDSATWHAFLYLLACLPLGIVSFAYGVVAISLGLSLAILIVGLVVGAALVLGAGSLAVVHRNLANKLLGTSIPQPHGPQPWTSVVEFAKHGLTYAAGWRAIAFFLIDFVVSLAFSLLSLIVFLLGLGMVTYPAWFSLLPSQQATDGTWHKGSQLGIDFFVDTPLRVVVFGLVGFVIFILVWPALNNALAKLQATLTASLLGPTNASLTRDHLESQRDRNVATSTNHMRSIERDLHDLTQAQLVAIAMQLSDVKDRLRSGETPESLATSIDSAHLTSKEALADLKDLVRGIHPAALDAGLETALRTRASRSSVPVSLSISVDDDVTPAVGTVAYYCVAELLNNVSKHSQATRALVVARTNENRLVVEVHDNGIGGVQEVRSIRDRAESIGGRVTIESPAGGPTRIGVDLPQKLTTSL